MLMISVDFEARSAKRRSELNIPRISIDLRPDDREQAALLDEELITTILLGCRKGIIRLGKLGESITVIRVKFSAIGVDVKNNHAPGPTFKFVFEDPLGQESYFGTDYRFLGKNGPRPSADEIAAHISEEGSMGLSTQIREHLEKCNDRIAKATTIVATQLS